MESPFGCIPGPPPNLVRDAVPHDFGDGNADRIYVKRETDDQFEPVDVKPWSMSFHFQPKQLDLPPAFTFTFETVSPDAARLVSSDPPMAPNYELRAYVGPQGWFIRNPIIVRRGRQLSVWNA